MEAEQQKKVVGRNEPCPCGSGKKHKRCCGVDAAPKLTPPSASLPGMGGAPAGGGMGAMGAMPPGGMPGGFDPSQLDPAWMMSFTQALQRLPKGQMQRLQALMQKAMSGRDVSQEAAELERSLPPDFKNLLMSFKMPGMPDLSAMAQAGEAGAPGDAAAALPDLSAFAGLAGMGAGALGEGADAGASGEMTAEDAKRIIEEAAASGKLSREQAESLLAGAEAASAEGASAAGAEGAESGETGKSGISRFWKKVTGKG